MRSEHVKCADQGFLSLQVGLWGVKVVAGKKKEGQDKLLDLVRGGGVVVKVVSESWNQKAGLLDRRSVHQD